MNGKPIIIILFFFSSFIPVCAQPQNTFLVERAIDWGAGRLNLTIVKNMEPETTLTPDYKYMVERNVRDQLPDIFLDAILEIYVDSSKTIKDMVIEKNKSIRELKEFYINGKHEGAYQSRDFKQTYVHYSFPFYTEKGFISLFVHHDFPMSLEKKIGFIPTKEYTGLIIYAKGSYLSYGTTTFTHVEPSLFPVLYDQQTNRVLDKWMCDPVFLKKWGMVAYSETSDTIDENAFLERIGLFPLRIMAHQIFGKHHSDIILPEEAVQKLLSNENNRHILQQGRILIIIDPENARNEE